MRIFLQKLFSIYNQREYKMLCLFGIRIKLIKKKIKTVKPIYNDLKVNKNKIVCSNMFSGGYGCNPKYITEYLIKHNNNYDMVWLTDKRFLKKNNFPDNIRLVDYKSKNAIYELSTAKLIIINLRIEWYYKNGWRKKLSQKLIQTWHGSFGIKKIGQENLWTNADKSLMRSLKLDSDNTDYIISNSNFETDIYKNSFMFNQKILEYGHPRNDVFFCPQEKKDTIRNKVLSAYGIDGEDKLVLYAPTFRDDKKTDCFKLNSCELLTALKENFRGNYKLLVRFHPRLKRYSSELFNFGADIIDASYYPDIQELLIASDAMITDYSSCIFDFMLSRKPAFVFATDIEEYNNIRGFYYKLEQTPFTISKNNAELAENIKNFDAKKYDSAITGFLKSKGSVEDGNASERVARLITDIMDGKQ
jgi:CDP-glycerol glycerophosphotransferase